MRLIFGMCPKIDYFILCHVLHLVLSGGISHGNVRLKRVGRTDGRTKKKKIYIYIYYIYIYIHIYIHIYTYIYIYIRIWGQWDP